MPSRRPVLASLALVSVGLWLTTAAANAQSVNLPSVPKVPPIAQHVTQAVQAVPAAQAVKQEAVATATHAAQPVTSVVQHTTSAATTVVKSTVKAVPTPEVPALPAVPNTPPVVKQAEAVVAPVVAHAQEQEVEEEIAMPTVVAVEPTTPGAQVVNESPDVHPVAEVAQSTSSSPLPPPGSRPQIFDPVSSPVVVEVTQDEPVPADEPVVVAESALPVSEAVIEIHDREAAPPALTTMTVTAWEAITPEPVSATPEPVVSPVSQDTAVEPPTLQRSDAVTRDATPPTNPLPVPPVEQPAVPVPAGPGSSLSFSAASLPVFATPSLAANWRRMSLSGRKVPSVIVLPNLAPPG